MSTMFSRLRLAALPVLSICLLTLGIASVAPASAQMLEKRNRYTLAPGDQMEVKFRLTPEFNQTVTVQPDGYIQLSIAGDVRVANLTVDDAEKAIASSSSKRLNNPEVAISLIQFQKPYFVVAGEVARPGRFDMHEDTTALQAMMLAGGPTVDGKASQIILFRRVNGANAEVKVLDLNNIKKTKDLERDMELQSGDTIYVTRTRVAKIQQFTRIANNLGFYINPLQTLP
jgi:polysaccharide export outer membrane protein